MDNIRVMVVEDNELDMEVITSALENADIEFVAVSKSTDALKVALEYKPSMAILDMNMPELNGKEVQAQLHTNPATSEIKTVFLSAEGNLGEVIYGVNVQASAYFKKGVQIGQLISSINAIDGTTKIRTSIDNFAALNRRMVEKYNNICGKEIINNG